MHSGSFLRKMADLGYLEGDLLELCEMIVETSRYVGAIMQLERLHWEISQKQPEKAAIDEIITRLRGIHQFILQGGNNGQE